MISSNVRTCHRHIWSARGHTCSRARGKACFETCRAGKVRAWRSTEKEVMHLEFAAVEGRRARSGRR
eukprot:6214509-Pleurochrysis_carterae.AAC.1